MNLHDIEKIVRANITFCKESEKRWVSTCRNGGIKNNYEATMGIIVFCGVAWQCGFNERAIKDHAEIDRKNYSANMMKFKRAYNEYFAAEVNDFFKDDTSFEQRIILKTKLVRNAIGIADRTQHFISLADLPY